MTAKLSRRPLNVGQGAEELTIDCPHGTTRGIYSPGLSFLMPESALIAMLVAKHERLEKCGCALDLAEKTA